MATAYELLKGAAEKSAGASSAIKYTRTWKVVKAERGESYDVPTLIGVDIGDTFPGTTDVYCTQLTDQPDGDSNMVRVITATYASPSNTGGGGGGGGGGGSRQVGRNIGLPPNVRPAVITVDSSYEMTNRPTWFPRASAEVEEWRNVAFFAMQPTGELVDDVQRPQPTLTYVASQFETVSAEASDFLALGLGKIGHVNLMDFALGGTTFPAKTLLLKGVSARPVTEQWGSLVFKGYNVTYTFAYRSNRQRVLVDLDETAPDWPPVSDEQEVVDIGWDNAVPLRGLNCRNTLNTPYPIDPYAFNLLWGDEGIVFGDAQSAPPAVGAGEGPIRIMVGGVEKSAYWGGTKFADLFNQQINLGNDVEGTMQRAMVSSPTSTGGFAQAPANQPIPLNPDGTPRGRYDRTNGYNPGDPEYKFGGIADPNNAVLSRRVGVYPAVHFAGLGIRI